MNPIGDFARADFAAMDLAQELQMLVVDYINDAFFAEEPLNINNLTHARFLAEYEKAKAGGPLAMSELDRQLAAILGPVLRQVTSMEQQQQGQPQAQNGNQ